MKRIEIFVLLMIIASFSPIAAQTADWETYDNISLLLSLKEAGAPVVHENTVIFTADSGLRKVGVAFAHENFAKVYWFRQLLIPNDRINPVMLPGEKEPSLYKNSGIQFHVQLIPDNIKELEYRMIINGLWTVDPQNLKTRRDPVSGLSFSVISMPYRQIKPNPLQGLPEGLIFTFNAPPGESVTVAGTFNSWDPFMYELREIQSGVYSLMLPLPPGTYQYVFIHRGERHVDPNNSSRIYARDGKAASVIVVP
ncbi:MAG: isoamylase [Treponema sp.]|nr:isoamylase [Treponema sp.]